MHVLGLYFGWPTGAVWSNLLASAICGVIVYLRMRAKLVASHRGLAIQNERHHAELQAQATAHHNEMKHQAAKHHQELLDRADVHHEALKQHITAQSRPVSSVPLEPQQIEEVLKAAARTKRRPS